jgi:hypothetical protein
MPSRSADNVLLATIGRYSDQPDAVPRFERQFDVLTGTMSRGRERRLPGRVPSQNVSPSLMAAAIRAAPRLARFFHDEPDDTEGRHRVDPPRPEQHVRDETHHHDER